MKKAAFVLLGVLLASCRDVIQQTPIPQATLESAALRLQPTISITDLGTLGGDMSEAWAINNRGEVVGGSTTASGAEHAFLWTKEYGLRDLGTLDGGYSIAHAINESGDVVGVSSLGTKEHAFLWTARTGMVDLGTLGGQWSDAWDINNRGEIVGFGSTAILDPKGSSRGFLWTRTTDMTNLGALTDGNSTAYGINDRGDAVGASTTFSGCCNVGPTEATLWTADGQMLALGTFHDRDTWANKISIRRTVVGYYESPRPFVWTTESGFQDLPTLSHTIAVANDVNERNDIVGWAQDENGNQPVLWHADGSVVLLGLLSGSSNGNAVSLNNRGDVVGTSGNHAVLWTAR